MSRNGGYDIDYDDKHTNHHQGSVKPTPRMVRPKKPMPRRNTVSVFDEIIANAENEDSIDQGKRMDKRSMKLQRGSERDLKLDIARAQTFTPNDIRELEQHPPKTPQPSMQVESSKHFKSLCSKRVLCSRRQVRSVSGNFNFNSTDLQHIGECPPSRVDFHKTLSMLIRMGANDNNKQVDRTCRRNLTREEHMWQNEVKDLIWLELQAWHANRTLTDEDNYLCLARDSVGSLLNEIMMYRFRRHRKRVSAHSIDSGVGPEDCTGCLLLTCFTCRDAQTDGMRDVEELLCRLEQAESLFPSSKAFAECYPLYDSDEFVGRVKAMCLWYNMTKHITLKLSLMDKFFRYFEAKFHSMVSSEGYNTGETSSSPSDSNSSSSSVNDFALPDYIPPLDVIGCLPLTCSSEKNSPYRKYIETILKTRGLTKSMTFLDKLHNHLLSKAMLTLEKPTDLSIFQKKPEDDQDEFRRYGVWSPEAQSLGLPSYKSAFLYLSTVPLKMLHEFLLMRLEQKPKNPSPLSVRQLMRELKEGLKICTKHRERIIMNFHVALLDSCEAKDLYIEALDVFDKCLLTVFEDYLEYLKLWATLPHDNFQKNLLEEEWKFIYEILPSIIGGRRAAIKHITYIISQILTDICHRVTEHIDEVAQEVKAEGKTIPKSLLFSVCRDLQNLFNEERDMISKTMIFSKMVLKAMKSYVNPELTHDFKDNYLQLRCMIPTAIEKVQNICDGMLSTDNLDDFEKNALTSRCREILLQGFRFGFEFHKEMSEFIPQEGRKKLTLSMVQFAHLWMKFTQERCERGRGKRPRWANQGLEFLLTVCEPQNTMYLSENEFEELKKSMDLCISHVIGSNGPLTPESALLTASPKLTVELVRPFSRARGASPSPKPTYRSQRSNSRKPSLDQSITSTPGSENGESSPQFLKKCESLQDGLLKAKSQSSRRSERILQAVGQLDTELDTKLRDAELIGHVVNCKDVVFKAHIRRRHVTFSWQRGIKIGQGRFGKVYTAVNNNTGEMMAVKEIAIQPNDAHTIRKVSEELKILEGVNHLNIVKYYGIEVQKEEMLIFMEFCPEGTLESLVASAENGLPEILIRRYTYQLVCGVAALHKNGVVHRDIKTANIFLSDEGNCLKIGDFGCAVKIKSHVTMPGELQGFVGTQAYMAPEMFMKTQSDGHGRAADIWSVGCVVVEMASGKRPWAEYDSNYQIMFKVGMGERPEAPDTLIDEGHDFLDRCLQHNAKDRATAIELLHHPFVQIGYDIN
ncbi:MEKK4 N-terminal [Popillia japonica]|uniref:Mitogen-activated protein kinase kinase kinase 4 n=1 Tax=Popillia japonica TaxID=7064 RepID=A0AAW1L9Z0_POPJA